LNICIDVETTIKNKGHAFDPDNKLVSYAISSPSSSSNFLYCTDPGFRRNVFWGLDARHTVVGFNFKFDLHWLFREGHTLNPDTKIWDVQLAEFIISGQTASFMSLNETLASYQLPLKHDAVKEYWDQGIDTNDIPVILLEEYNVYDTEGTLAAMQQQQELMSPKQIKLVYLLGEDLKTLQDAEFNGIKWDAKKAKTKLEKYKADVASIERRLASYLPNIQHGSFNFDSGDHLSCLLYGGEINFEYTVPESALYKSGPNKGEEYVRNRHYKENVYFGPRFTPLANTEVKKTKGIPNVTTRYYQVDAPTLSQLKPRLKPNKELLVLLQERSDKQKIIEMIESIEKTRTTLNWQDDLLHPQFNQNIVITGRLSSSKPNMQNTPLEVDELLISRYD